MNYKEYFKQLEQNAEYRETEEGMRVINDLADDILNLRMEKGWSQSELAERAGTKQANISRLESGLSNPSVNFLQKVSKALNTFLSIRLEKPPVKEIYISSDSDNKSQNAYPVSNWPTHNIYKTFELSSPKQENYD